MAGDGTVETIWKCGDPYRHTLPVLQGDDPWLGVLRDLREKDELRCQRWREELQSSLLNASIFAAVVTAFLIDTYKNMEDDPVEAMLIQVLSQIGNATENPLLGAKSAKSEKITIILNHSLALSLIAHVFIILMSVISLQWLREHLQTPLPDTRLNPRICFSMYQMRIESADRSYIPTVPGIIAVVQQHAIIAFLAGLGALLIEAHWTVGVTWIVGSSVVFLLMAGTVVHSGFKALQVFKVGLFIDRVEEQFVTAAIRAPWDTYDDAPPAPSPYMFTFSARHDPLRGLHDLAWLLYRDQKYGSQEGVVKISFDDYSKVPEPLYDAIQGLIELKKTSTSRQTDFTMVDYCIETVLTANEGLPGYPYLIHRASQAIPLSFGIPSGTQVEDPAVMLDDATLHLFSRNVSFDSLPLAAERRALEICVRLTEWMFGREFSVPYEDLEDDDYNHPQRLPIEWVAHVLANRELEPELVEAVRCQICLVVLRFFERIKSVDVTMALADSTMDYSKYLGSFLESCAKVLARDGDWKGLGVCNDIFGILLARDDTRPPALQAAVALCIALVSARPEDIPPPQPLLRLVTALYKFERQTGGLRHGTEPHLTLNWDQFLGQARKLGADIDEGDVDDVAPNVGEEHTGRKPRKGSPADGRYGELESDGRSETEDEVTANLLHLHNSDDTSDLPRHVVLDVAVL